MKMRDKSAHEVGVTADELNPFRRGYFTQFKPNGTNGTNGANVTNGTNGTT
jgi:hypothetical protein